MGPAGLERFELKGSYAKFRPRGPTTVQGFLTLLREVMKTCQEKDVARLLVDLTELRHKRLSLTDKFWWASGLAEFWDRRIKLALVGRAKHMDREGFGRMVAANRGLHLGVFTGEGEALEWLLAGPPAGGLEK